MCRPPGPRRGGRAMSRTTRSHPASLAGACRVASHRHPSAPPPPSSPSASSRRGGGCIVPLFWPSSSIRPSIPSILPPPSVPPSLLLVLPPPPPPPLPLPLPPSFLLLPATSSHIALQLVGDAIPGDRDAAAPATSEAGLSPSCCPAARRKPPTNTCDSSCARP